MNCLLLPLYKIKKKLIDFLSSSMSISSSEHVSEESEYSTVSTSEMELLQHQPSEEETLSEEEKMEDEPFEEPVRAQSPIMWKGIKPLDKQVAAEPLLPLPPPLSAEEITDQHIGSVPVRGHRVPAQLLNIRTDRWVGTHNKQNFINDIARLREACEVTAVAFIDVYREEAPTTGHVHYHSIVVFNSKVPAHRVIQIDPFGRWEPMRGQIITAWNYASKGGQRAFMFGEAPISLQNHFRCRQVRQAKREGPTPAQQRFNELVQRAKAGDESIRDEMVYARYQNYFDKILISVFLPVMYEGELSQKNLWICGPPGTGKSRMVYQYAQERRIRIYHKLQNKWWDGYSGQELVLVEDADPSTMRILASHMKVWSDRYPFTAEVKGSARMMNSLFEFVITSNYSIDDCFNSVDATAIKRRFDILEMN